MEWKESNSGRWLEIWKVGRKGQREEGREVGRCWGRKGVRENLDVGRMIKKLRSICNLRQTGEQNGMQSEIILI